MTGRLVNVFVASVLMTSVGVVVVSSSAFPPCAVEDSPGPCVWDAGSRGNGQGSSFVAIPEVSE